MSVCRRSRLLHLEVLNGTNYRIKELSTTASGSSTSLTFYDHQSMNRLNWIPCNSSVFRIVGKVSTRTCLYLITGFHMERENSPFPAWPWPCCVSIKQLIPISVTSHFQPHLPGHPTMHQSLHQFAAAGETVLSAMSTSQLPSPHSTCKPRPRPGRNQGMDHQNSYCRLTTWHGYTTMHLPRELQAQHHRTGIGHLPVMMCFKRLRAARRAPGHHGGSGRATTSPCGIPSNALRSSARPRQAGGRTRVAS